ncbi:MAG: hypothetical protein ACI8T1_003082 [Verrucomicrobiales bacterium]
MSVSAALRALGGDAEECIVAIKDDEIGRRTLGGKERHGDLGNALAVGACAEVFGVAIAKLNSMV